MKVFVKPGGPDRRVPWPTGDGRLRRYFPNDPAAPSSQVELSDYIQRRLNDGDLVQTDDKGVPLKKPGADEAPAAAPAAGAAKSVKEG